MKKALQFRYLVLLAILLNLANLANAEPSISASRSVEGVYRLEGIGEMAATLILHRDNRFEYSAMYGGADPRANGLWSIENGVVHLVSDQRPPKYTSVHQDREALPELTDSYGILPAMAVTIATTSMGMKWSNVNVAFKFANGRTRSGMTNWSGVAYLGARPEPEWKVPITEVGLALPEDTSTFFWIKVNDRKITRIAVEFEPGATAQAFREEFLEIEEGEPLRLVTRRSQGELRGTYVWQGSVKSRSNP